MKLKSFLAKPYAAVIQKKIRRNMTNALADQQAIFQQQIKSGKATVFGKDHQLGVVNTYAEYTEAVPVRDYEGIKDYIEQIKNGTENVLWKGKPMYFAKTSGTTSGIKYIPITKDSIDNHIDTAKYALLNYMAETGRPEFADGKMIFLSGSPTLERVGGIPTGRLSGIVNHFVPGYLRRNQMPSFETNCIEDWETKLGKIVTETSKQDMRLISGIPPWMQMYFDWLSEANEGKKIKDLFPNLQVIVHGGVNFEPYRAKLMESIGKTIDTVETFPASEGFFAYQDSQQEEGLLLNTNSGIFFEFIPVAEVFNPSPKRLSLADVQVGENYALIVNSNAGLWGYNIGDTVKFVSVDPYRIVVTGRIKHFISAFGEHVIAEEVEHALRVAAAQHGAHIIEFTVAPMIQTPDGSLPYHEWLISFEQEPDSLQAFAQTLDNVLREKNVYYDDLIRGGILQTIRISRLQPKAFIEYMRSIGKLGGQNKVPRLSNDRVLAEGLKPYLL
ncbi:MAG: GH3 auxin-responsive promoter family protein [Chitinophagaceae bacterium]|nr:GH3 auxin-responsive promoter family protein [Chitinophagaceae bacterium]